MDTAKNILLITGLNDTEVYIGPDDDKEFASLCRAAFNRDIELDNDNIVFRDTYFDATEGYGVIVYKDGSKSEYIMTYSSSLSELVRLN